MGLNWESTYEVALALRQAHAGVDLAELTLAQIYAWIMELPDFADDASLCNEEILMSIFQEWYEVMINA